MTPGSSIIASPELLLVEAHLYRLLAVNCEEKARMAEELGRS
jgi:hypothetical protein